MFIQLKYISHFIGQNIILSQLLGKINKGCIYATLADNMYFCHANFLSRQFYYLIGGCFYEIWYWRVFEVAEFEFII